MLTNYGILKKVKDVTKYIIEEIEISSPISH